MRPETITAIGSFTALTNADDDYLAIDPSRCTGFADAPLRTTFEPIPGADGVLILPAYDDAQILTLAGDLIVTSTGSSSESGYQAAVDTLLASLKTALDAMKSSAGTLTHSGGSLSVWKQAPIDASWALAGSSAGVPYVMQVTFGLVVDVT